MENNTGRMWVGLRALEKSNGSAAFACNMLAFYDYLVQHEGKSLGEARELCKQAMSLMGEAAEGK